MALYHHTVVQGLSLIVRKGGATYHQILFDVKLQHIVAIEYVGVCFDVIDARIHIIFKTVQIRVTVTNS